MRKVNVRRVRRSMAEALENIIVRLRVRFRLSAVDALASLLDGPRARGAFLLRSVLDPPWAMRIQDRAPLTMMCVVQNVAWVIPQKGSAVRLDPGDVALLRGPEPYTVADHPATPPRVVIHPGQRCTTPAGEPLGDRMWLGVRTWGDAPGGNGPDEVATGTSAVMFTGTYQMAGEVSDRLLRALPALLVLPAGAWDSSLVRLLGQEIVKNEPGQDVFLDRLLDLLLIAVLRAWFSRPEATVPAWYRAGSDPVVGKALRLLHNDPALPWTVAAMAARIGVSRAALARRFTELVGEPPMTYLTGWRLALAADLLRERHTTIGAVARQVGYGSPYALSTAFKRVRGVSPQEYRAQARRHGP